MTAIPDTATTVVRASHVPGPPQGRWTYGDYASLPDHPGYRYEVIDGVLYMAPAPIPEHERIVIHIGARLFNALEETGLGQVFGSPDIDAGLVTLRPDVVVVLAGNEGAVAENRIVGAPDLVVEVSSPSTAAYDRDRTAGKLGAYERIGVREYWIVDTTARTVEVFALDQGLFVAAGIASGDEVIPSRLLPDLALAARRCFPPAG